MWFTRVVQDEDAETLLEKSPGTSKTEYLFVAGISWRFLPRLLLDGIFHCLVFIVPTFLRRTPSSLQRSEKWSQQVSTTQKKHRTEYLDGVRGLGSFIVFIFHWVVPRWPGIESGYVSGAEDASLWQLPFINFAYAGSAMVSIFFVVSGYVLTHRFVLKMHRQQYDSLFSDLSSLAFRRGLRLFLPSLVSCMLVYLCISLHLVPAQNTGETVSYRLETLITDLDHVSNPWSWDIYLGALYNYQLWTITFEYRGSMAVFIMVLGLARCRTSVRMLVEALTIAHAFGHQRWGIALFVAGLLISEIDVRVSSSAYLKELMQKKRAKSALVVVVLLGIFFCGVPRLNADQSFGYSFLQYSWPFDAGYRPRFWVAIGAILVIGPMPFLPFLQSFFCTRLMRYLGDVSFALYLTHVLSKTVVGEWLLYVTWNMLGNEERWNYALGLVVSTTLYTPIAIWFADVFWRAVDIPSTTVTKWLESRCLAMVTST